MATANLLQTSVSGGTQNALSLQGDGVFFPKASTTSRLALTLGTTDKGFIVYDTTDNNIYFWNGTAWESIPGSGDAGANGSVQYNDNGIVSGATNFTYDKVTSAVSVAGDLTVDTNVLAVNATTNTVGIGTTSTDAKFRILDASGNGVRIGFLPATFNYNLYDATVHEFRAPAGTNSFGAITANGIGLGVTPSASGIGVVFPAVQSASSDANCLDDYEEGVWSPTVSVTTANITAVASVNARYTKVGRVVTLSGQVSGVVTAPNLDTYWILLGLPFAQGSITVGTLMENAGLRIGVTQVTSSNLYSYFPSPSGITAGPKDVYYETTYTV